MSVKQTFEINGERYDTSLQVTDKTVCYGEAQGDVYRYEVIRRSRNGIALRIFFNRDGVEHSEEVYISRDRDQYQLRRGASTVYARTVRQQSSGEEERHDLYSPMPGFIRKIFVKEGDEVQKGDRLAILEAMKMEHTLTAPYAGRVQSVLFAEGDRVGQDEIVVKIG